LGNWENRARFQAKGGLGFVSVLHSVHTVFRIAQELGNGVKWLESETFSTEIKNARSYTSIPICLNGGVLN